MNAPTEFVRIIGRKRYDVATATLVAHDCYWDGHNFERSGRNCFLYRTPKGAYFTVNLSQWQGESDTLTPVSEADAIDLYEGALREHAVNYAAAFPGVKVEEA
jgi:hypothetical protein